MSLILYHGSKNQFLKPEIQDNPINGRDYGPGFYLTDSSDFAKKYGPILYRAQVSLKQSINGEKITFSKKQLDDLLRYIQEHDGNDYVENYGDPTNNWKIVEQTALKTLLDNQSDLEIICDLYYSTHEKELIGSWLYNNNYTHYQYLSPDQTCQNYVVYDLRVFNQFKQI